MKCSRGRVSVAFVGLLVAVIAAAPKAVPDEVTRLAMFKRGEADIVYVFRGAAAETCGGRPVSR